MEVINHWCFFINLNKEEQGFLLERVTAFECLIFFKFGTS